MSSHISRRVWVQNVAVSETVLRARLDALKARRVAAPDPEADAIDSGVRTLLDKASNAAYRIDPRPRRLSNWWRGSLFEAAYQNLHAAESQIVLLYEPDELRAELPEAVARVEQGLQKDDPRRADAQRVATSTDLPDPREISKIIQVGFSASDQLHTRVRSFRNVVLMAAGVLTIFLVAFSAYVSTHPTTVPLCFRQTVAAAAAQTNTAGTTSGSAAPTSVHVVCPTSESTLGQGGGPQGRDVLVVGLVGLLGGALASAIALRNVRGTSTPYDVPVSLALLKLPTAALTALAALIAIRGDFVPGLSALDSQEQILAYALAFGYAQQLLTGLVDRQGQSILAGVPGKDPSAARPSTVLANGLPASTTAAAGAPADDDPDDAGLPDDDLDDSDIPDPEARDTADATIVDDSDTVEDLPDDDDDDDDDGGPDPTDDFDPNAADELPPSIQVSPVVIPPGRPSSPQPVGGGL